MLVANSFNLWKKDVFFPAAEEVQESADMYVPFYFYWFWSSGFLLFCLVSVCLEFGNGFSLVLALWDYLKSI